MPVSLTFESQEAAPEAIREHLVEKDGKFLFEAETLSEVENLSKTAKSERERRVRLEKEAKGFERFKPLAEADDDEFAQFLESWTKRGEKNGDGKEPQAELNEKLHKRELKTRDDELQQLRPEIEKLRGEVREYRLWTPLREMFIASGGEPKDWQLARLDLANQRRFDFDEEGKIVVMEDNAPSGVSPERFFKEVYSDQQPKLYKASGAGGGGANPGQKSGSTNKSIKRDAYDRLSAFEREAKIKAGFSVVD